MSFILATPSISEYTDAAICYGLVECLLRGAPESLLEVYSRGTVYEVHCGLDVEAGQEALRDGLRDALDELLEGVASTQRLPWVYAAASGGMQPKRRFIEGSLKHLREVSRKLSSNRVQDFRKFLNSVSGRSHSCRGGWPSLTLVPEWGKKEKGLFNSPERRSKLCSWCYALAWVGLHNFALFTRHKRDRDVSCTVALMIPGPSEKPYAREDLLAVRELGTKYQQEPWQGAPPAPYAFLLWALSRGETILPLELSGRSFLASVVRLELSGQAVAIRNFQVAPVWRLLRFISQAKRRTFRFHSLINDLLRRDGGANADTVQQLAESILFADADGLYRALRSIRGVAQKGNFPIEPGIVDAAFEAISG